jgi:4-amino-4-deoxy-L-arabinose transferase-like glycosyltransferase
MAFFLGLAVLALAIWIESRRRPDLLVAMLLFAGAANTKNEGLVGTVVVLAAGILVLAAHRSRRRSLELLIAAIVMSLLAILPWHVWLLDHNLKGDVPFPGGLSPSYLADHLSRVKPGVLALYDQLINIHTVAVAIPIALAVIVMRLRRPSRSVLVWFYLVGGLLYFAALVWAYWVNPIQIRFLLATSADRVYVGLAFIHLTGTSAAVPAAAVSDVAAAERPAAAAVP